jgi:hypothetical protein
MKRRRVGIIALAFLSICAFGYAQIIEDEITIFSPVSASLGGTHVASARGFSSLFANPALFSNVPSELSISELDVGLTGPVFTIGSILLEGMDSGDFLALLTDPAVQELLNSIYASLKVNGPLYFGYLGNGLGFGIFNSTEITIDNPRPLALEMTVEESVILAGGYSFRIHLSGDHFLDLGILLKGMLKGELSIEKSLIELPSLFDTISVETLTSAPFSLVSAIGFDAGILYSFGDVFSFGISGRDLYTPTLRTTYSTLQDFLDNAEGTAEEGIVPLTLNAGLMIAPRLGKLEQFITDFRILLDYEDILDFALYPATATHPLLHIGFGTEIVLLDIMSLRAGFYQGLFAAGLGLDLTVFTLNASMFGTEISSEVGMNPVYNVQVGFEFRI